MSKWSPIDVVMSTVVLAGFWLLWSFHFTSLMMTLGAMSVLFTVYITVRMGVADKEGHPYHLGWRPLRYVPWLLWEIVLANIDVTRRVFSMKISPTLLEVDCSQKTVLGKVIYANSITLTPGTISLRIRDGKILVHALSTEGAGDLAEGAMDKQVTWLEGKS